jgi:hypothetical protein
MFRFTIRELVLLTLVVALGVAWCLDRRMLQVAIASHRARSEKFEAAARRLEAEQQLLGQKYNRLIELLKERSLMVPPVP